MLLIVLLLMGVFLIMGMGFIQQRVGQSRAMNLAINDLQSQSLARSGLEDALAKLAKHHDFPPLSDISQNKYVYTERVVNLGGQDIGGFTVSIDTKYQAHSFWIIRISSRGFLGAQTDPQAQSTVFAELDMSKVRRPLPTASSPKVPNPNFFEWLFVTQGEFL
jgi:hypothetical protein